MGDVLIALVALVAAATGAFAGYVYDTVHPVAYKRSKPSALRQWLERNFGLEMGE